MFIKKKNNYNYTYISVQKLGLSVRRFEIVYYSPWEVKTWTVHSLCKLTPEGGKHELWTVQIFSILVRNILCFTIPGPKIPHSRF